MWSDAHLPHGDQPPGAVVHIAEAAGGADRPEELLLAARTAEVPAALGPCETDPNTGGRTVELGEVQEKRCSSVGLLHGGT